MSNNRSNSNSWLGYLLAAGVGATAAYFAATSEQPTTPMRHTTRPTCRFPCSPPDICVLCQEPISPVLVQLPCFHMFHRNCFARWGEHNRKPELECPVCRKTIPSDFDLSP